MSIKDKVSNFISQLGDDGENLFPYLANKDWKPGNNIYYSGPYWDEQEPVAAITTLLNGKWLPAGEQVNKFEAEFGKRFKFRYNLMVNSGSSANLVMRSQTRAVTGGPADEAMNNSSSTYSISSSS